MAETRESLIKKIQSKEAELRDLEMKCQGYWDLSQVAYAKDCPNSKSAYKEAQRLSRQINSRRNAIRKMYERLNNM